MAVVQVHDDWLAIEPAEGAGRTREYFDLRRLADGSTEITQATWDVLVANPPFHESVEDLARKPWGTDETWRQALLRWAEGLRDPQRPEVSIAALSAQIIGTRPEHVPALLNTYGPALLETYPEGSFWFLRADELLGRRLAAIRVLLSVSLVPDFLDHVDDTSGAPPSLSTLRAQSSTGGLSFGGLLDPLMVAFSPCSLGFTFDWMPHAIPFLFGFPGSNVRTHPATPWALHDPRIQQGPFRPGHDWSFGLDLSSGEIESLLQWWVGRLNTVYSHLADPTRFCGPLGHHEPERQTAWLLTFERMLADLVLVQSFVQGPELARQQASFDLLDKAESLLGFGRARTGKGFERLLRRRSMVVRLDEVWARLPVQVQARFRAQTRRAFDGLYDGAVAHALRYRAATASVRVAMRDGRVAAVALEDYVPSLVRAIRNSAHGFIDVLSGDTRDRRLLASHDGSIAPELADVAVLICLGLVADFESVASGAWLPAP